MPSRSSQSAPRGCRRVRTLSGSRRPLPALRRPPGSDDLHGARLRPLLSLDNLELDLRALLQDGAPGVVRVNKHVLPATIRRDEPKTLGCVEKLDRPFLHLPSPLPLFQLPESGKPGTTIRQQTPEHAHSTPCNYRRCNRVSLTT